MNSGEDFLNFIPCALSIKILKSLHDPSDLVRIIAISHSWRQFVIRNGLCKHLSLRMFPQLSRVDHVNELCGSTKGHIGPGSCNFMKWKALKREYRVYAFLARQCSLLTVWDCLSEAIIASTTGNFPRESINNTLEESSTSYWSSKGDSNPAVLETLTYKLAANFYLIKEIGIRPYKGNYFNLANVIIKFVFDPAISAKSVRFRLGHIKSSPSNHVDDPFSWTYTLQKFEMSQAKSMKNNNPKALLGIRCSLNQLYGGLVRCCQNQDEGRIAFDVRAPVIMGFARNHNHCTNHVRGKGDQYTLLPNHSRPPCVETCCNVATWDHFYSSKCGDFTTAVETIDELLEDHC
ncbi:F-box protein At4g00755-like [Hibiscus syriacus]|uniref:F-box protein At4g00755-like n=1 Tax=Hibiscus syriacus TaxID=106335 RepID=UPI00192121F3|nr:F-box protein At4g00755-like [Hibiscus syriacus]